ncbi:unnamed protein product [Linum trigynum]|uniref:Endonuclease/exonuclease/phosphatase domain-containing protein n=1 Tax=Linum trigynum TaxID=586398 RepID=A0AAV2FCH6_9ROSI
MRTFSYNCPGLGNTRVVGALKSLLRQTTPSLVFLSETKQIEEYNEEFRKKLGYDKGDAWSTNQEGGGRAGGVALWWKEEVLVQVMSSSLHHIDAKVIEKDGVVWRFTGVYGWSKNEDKHNMWELMTLLNDQWRGPWLCGGDFNQIVNSGEKSGGRLMGDGYMEDFRLYLAECGLKDLVFHGYPFTWDNRRKAKRFVEERLDLFVATNEWQVHFPEARILHLDRDRSDHRPLVCDPKGEANIEVKWGWQFRFEPHWVRHDGCKQTVAQVRSEEGHSETVNKLDKCRLKLDQWSKETFPNYRTQPARIKKEIRKLDWLRKTNVVLDQRRTLESELAALDHDEELFWKQRSRANWLKGGDKNTNYFHWKASSRKKRNTLKKLQDEAGKRYVGQEELFACMVTFCLYSQRVHHQFRHRC